MADHFGNALASRYAGDQEAFANARGLDCQAVALLRIACNCATLEQSACNFLMLGKAWLSSRLTQSLIAGLLNA